MNKSLLLVIILLYLANARAQDPNFSQFFASPLTLNPALTGKFNGDFRIAGNYRNQWPTISNAFITSTASIDFGILRSKLPETDTWGVGFLGVTDKTANGILTSNYFSITTAYHKGLDEDGLHQIGVGFQGTYGNKRLDGAKLNFEDELDQFGGWNNPTTEPINNQRINISYVDVSAGALYSGSTNVNNNIYAGASVYHIGRPSESFLGDGLYRLNTRLTFHAGGYFPVATNTTLHISTLHSRQAGARNTVIGGALEFNLDENENPTTFHAGSWIRLGDAIIPYMGLEFGSFRLGASYDINISKLTAASRRQGGIELSLIFIKQPKDGRPKVPCPKY